MASTRLYRTPGSAGNRLKWTWSSWVKLAPQSTNNTYWGQTFLCASSDANNYTELALQNSGLMDFVNVTGGSTDARLVTSKYFRDPTAFYHIVAVWDSANVTAGDRMKIYINGVEETAFGTDTNPSSSLNSNMNNNILTEVGSREGGNNYFNGAMAHTHFCDGYTYAASDFGETDSTSGIWVPKTSPSVSYGTNGYFLKYVSGATGTDSSGQGNTQTVAGTITSPKDNPQNNYCKMNSLDSYYPSATFTNALTTIATDNATWTTATQWLQSGLWYWEVQPTGTLGGGECMGILDRVSQGTTENVYSGSGLYGAVVRSGGNVYLNSSDSGNISPSGDLWATGDVIGIYIDLNANKIYFAKNGTILNSGTGKALTDPLSTLNFAYTPVWGSSNSSASTANFNFGTRYLGTTALTGTTYTDSNSEGKFKYSPNNSGGSSFDGSAKNFLAICTNNIATGS